MAQTYIRGRGEEYQNAVKGTKHMFDKFMGWVGKIIGGILGVCLIAWAIFYGFCAIQEVGVRLKDKGLKQGLELERRATLPPAQQVNAPAATVLTPALTPPPTPTPVINITVSNNVVVLPAPVPAPAATVAPSAPWDNQPVVRHGILDSTREYQVSVVEIIPAGSTVYFQTKDGWSASGEVLGTTSGRPNYAFRRSGEDFAGFSVPPGMYIFSNNGVGGLKVKVTYTRNAGTP